MLGISLEFNKSFTYSIIMSFWVWLSSTKRQIGFPLIPFSGPAQDKKTSASQSWNYDALNTPCYL